MYTVKENYPLLEYNTFQVAAKTRFFIELNDVQSALAFLQSKTVAGQPCFILGGGSNVLFTGDYEGFIIHPVIKGIHITHEDDASVSLSVGSGEEWDGLAAYCAGNNWGGIENLSFIPGLVGASPVQNIGAYGVEIKDYIESVEGYMLDDGRKIQLSASECRFSYRNSIFKNELKNKVLLTHVNLRLNKKPALNTSYPDLNKEMDNFAETNVRTIREAIIQIRKRKLPDPAQIGNAGSFFKNPIVQEDLAIILQKSNSGIPMYKYTAGYIKLSAAWLIEQSGWKGKTYGNAGTHVHQPLIIINRGGATGDEILQCALAIQQAVKDRFGIMLETEVNIL